jgi:hypothetical protein
MIVKLLSACGSDGQGQAQIIASFTGAHLDGGGIEVGIKLLGNLRHGFCKTIDPCAHHFDGKVAGVFNQRLFSRVAWDGGYGGCAHGIGLWLAQI